MDSSLMGRIPIKRFSELSAEAQLERVARLRATRFIVQPKAKVKKERKAKAPKTLKADAKLMAAFAKLPLEQQQLILKKLEGKNVQH